MHKTPWMVNVALAELKL